MTPPRMRGRPPISSQDVIADAASDLFLEMGYEATSITEIARRAGVSRSTYFNYFESKAEILWFVLDSKIRVFESVLADRGRPFSEALASFGQGEVPELLALAIVDARTMGVEEELDQGRALRQLRLTRLIIQRLGWDGESGVSAEIKASAYAGALIGALWRWAELGAGRNRFDQLLDEYLGAAHQLFA